MFMRRGVDVPTTDAIGAQYAVQNMQESSLSAFDQVLRSADAQLRLNFAAEHVDIDHT
jgi:hypothetical protein